MSLLSKVIALITPENVGKCMDGLSKGIQLFGDSMDTMTKELSSDMAKSDKRARKQGTKDRLMSINYLERRNPCGNY